MELAIQFCQKILITSNYTVNTPIEAYYDPADPKDVEINPIPKFIGWLAIVFALLIIAGVWFWVWATRKSKVITAATGAKGIWDILT